MQSYPPKHLARRPGLGPLGRASSSTSVLQGTIVVVVVAIMAVALISNYDRSGVASGDRSSDGGAGASPITLAADDRPVPETADGAASSNLVSNWSFERDLTGWRVVGAATIASEAPGRTSGSCALVRASGSQPGRIGLALPGAVRDAPKGSRYVASAWVRATAAGTRVTVRLVGQNGSAEASDASATTLPGLSWRRVIVDHTVAAAGTALDLQVTADGVARGDALLVDEVVVRKG
jgi:hypothetical protein